MPGPVCVQHYTTNPMEYMLSVHSVTIECLLVCCVIQTTNSLVKHHLLRAFNIDIIGRKLAAIGGGAKWGPHARQHALAI